MAAKYTRIEVICHICKESLTYVKVYTQIYIDINSPISLGGHNLGTFYIRKLKLSMLLSLFIRPKKKKTVIFPISRRTVKKMCRLIFFSTRRKNEKNA